ncbi:unnamed protein product [Linum trigynum]|uniref:Pentatricopeptide repeat-containing protein n=2 Tax=Linum trigynum TaxID=586398 RepID=A0AAV2DLI6_9ROSI
MISGYSENGFFKEAQLSFRDLLRHWYSGFSLSTLLAIIPSCSFPGGIQFGKSIHCCHLKTGFSNNTIAVNSLMHMYISCGDFSAALSFLQSIYLIADVDSWNTIIVGCTQNCRFREALKTFNLMRQETSINPDASIYVNVISACGNLELALEGKSIHALSIKTPEGSDQRVQNSFITMYGRCGDIEGARTAFVSSSDHNLCSWNCMISAFSQNKDGRGAIELFRSINLEPNEITIVGILSACTQIGVLRHGKQIHAYTIRRGFHSNSYLSAALVDMYSNCGRLDTGVQVFSNSRERNVTAWNSMISAHGNNGEGRKAIALFNEMLRSGVVANKSTFVSLLSACGHSGLVDEGMYYYGCMLEKYGVQPTVDHQVYMVDMLGRSGRLEKALDFVMQTEALAEPGIWGALLSACNYHGDVGMGREVANVLFKLEPQNAGYYVSLSNMYVAAGRWKEAVELRNIVEEKKLKKPVGYSSIDVCSM